MLPKTAIPLSKASIPVQFQSVFPMWTAWFRGFGLDPDSPELGGFRQEFDAKALKLRERFGPRDPVNGVPTR